MALSLFKSPQEEPWERFSRAMDRALKSASADFSRRFNRTVRLGSPVKLAEAGADVIRVPVEVRGGPRQYAVAHIHIKDIDKKPDGGRIQALAREAVRAAEPYGEAPPAKPGETVLTYP